MQRRTFLKGLVAALNSLVALALAIPGAAYLLTPVLRRQPGGWIEIGREQDFDKDAVTKTTYRYIDAAGYTREEKRAFAWVRRQENGEIIALSPKCTHMGCNVAWVQANARFECPCHGGIYDINGQVIAGPPPRPLDRYPIKIENERIFIERTEG